MPLSVLSARSERQLRFFRLAFVMLADVDVELGQHLELAFVEDRLVGADSLLKGLQDLATACFDLIQKMCSVTSSPSACRRCPIPRLRVAARLIVACE